MLQRPALLAILAYQRYLSPRKGYGCAYRLAYGGTGCSGYAKSAITDHGAFRATPLIIKRFADCKTAALALSETPKEAYERRKKRKKGRWYDYCDPCGGCSCPSPRGKSAGADASSDCSPDCTPDCCSF